MFSILEEVEKLSIGKEIMCDIIDNLIVFGCDFCDEFLVLFLK